MDVLAHKMKVLSATDLMIMKLLSLREQHLNYTSTARSIREQIDWKDLRERTAWSPYAAAFFIMCEGLHICPKAGDEEEVSTSLTKIQSTLGLNYSEHRSELLKLYKA